MNDSLGVFAVNRCRAEEYLLNVNLLDFDGFVPVEHIEMAGFAPTDGNDFSAAPVKPVTAKLPESNEIHIKPFSWNVIRFRKK